MGLAKLSLFCFQVHLTYLPDIAVLVLIFNAAKTCPTMPALFSDHTFRHYAYLRDSLSHLVPALRVRGKHLLSVPSDFLIFSALWLLNSRQQTV